MNVIELRVILAKKGMRQKDLAKAAGITEAAISKYIHGQRKPNGYTIGKIANALDLTNRQIIDIFIER